MIEQAQQWALTFEGTDFLWLVLHASVLMVSVGACLYCRKISRHVERIGSKHPTAPTPDLIRYWQRQMERHEPGSPKWKAYRDRLTAIGD